MNQSKSPAEPHIEGRRINGRLDMPCSWVEWQLTRSRPMAYLFDMLINRPRRAFHTWRWKRCQTEKSLSHFESKTFSQFGEDGIIAEIFSRIGEGERFFVEFGMGDGSECCTRKLAVESLWNGVLIEGNPTDVESARRLYALSAGVKITGSFITAENILDLFEAQCVPSEPDLLVVDIDGNDYWVWDRILTLYRPRVVVIEYNARWVPPVEWIMPYNPDHSWARCAFFGASLTSLWKLGRRYGYSLVGCSSNGVNAFFVRNDGSEKQFLGHDLGAEFHYAPPTHGQRFGHSLHSRM